jgi:hypothetical protein
MAGRRVVEKYNSAISSPELACKIDDAENVDLYQTGPAGYRLVRISRFGHAKKQANSRTGWAEFTKWAVGCSGAGSARTWQT